jgi:glycerate 2-kinase
MIDQAKSGQEKEHNFLAEFDYSAHLVGSNTLARRAAAAKVESLRLPVIESVELLHGDILELAPRLATRLAKGANGVYIWGGEPTVLLPEHPGTGGRNQSLAVALAIETAEKVGVSGLVAGTDGSDGPTDAAGGFFYSGMPLTGAKDALLRADAGTWLSALGQQFVTGPTGTNVMDLAIVIKHA